MEVRVIEGDFKEAGPGKAWFRLNVPLVQDEETTAVERVAAAADFGNGLSNLAGLDRSWVFINPDLEIRMSRPPTGEWVYLDSNTTISPTGTGLARSSLADEIGWLGVAAQSLFVDAAPGN
jgi:Acyl-CoA thioesterase C-terminal domain